MNERSSTPQKVMSIKEFGKAYGLSRSTIYNLMDTGQLRSFKVGTRRLIPVEAAEQWFATTIQSSEAS